MRSAQEDSPVHPPYSAEQIIANYERHGLAVSVSILRDRPNSL